MKDYIKDYIKSDLFRYYGNCSFFSLLKGLKSRTVRFQICYRMAKAGGGIGKLLWKVNRTKKYQLQIPLEADIGYGLYIAHGGPVIMNPTTKIGNNCNLSQYTTIGSNHNHAAEIGDNVYIGPNVCIIENVKIGNNVTIGAGSIVTKDIPENATVAGNYAKILNYNYPGRYVSNRWDVTSHT